MAMKNYYQILGVRKDAGLVEIKKAYYKIVKEIHPDAQGGSVNKEDEGRFVEITEAYQLLRDPNRRRIYDRELKHSTINQQDLHAGSAQTAVNKKAETYFKNAVFRYKKGELKQSLQLFEAALHIDKDNPKYLSYYGLCLSTNPSTLHKAREYCEKAIEIEFFQPAFYTNLGIVYFNAKLYSRAKRQFEDALNWDPSNKRAMEYLKKIEKIKKRRKSSFISGIFNIFKKD